MKVWSKALSPQEIETNYVGSDLLAHYKFEDNAEDASGYKRHGSNNGVTYINDGERGKVAKFDGVDDYIDTNFDFHPSDYGGELTASVWMRTDNWGDAYARLLDADSWSMTRDNIGEGIRFYTYHNNTDGLYYYIKPNLSLTGKNWHHVALVMKPNGTGGTLKELYVDGKKVSYGSANLPLRKNRVNMLIGKWSVDDTKNFEGFMDDVKIWKKAFTAAEIETEFNSTKKYEPLIAHYTFNGDFNDQSTYQRHGTAHNGVALVDDLKRGEVAKFDGVDDYIDTNFDFHPSDYGGELTASVWMRTDNWGDAYARLLDADSWSMTRANTDNGIRFYTYHNNTDGLYYWLEYNPISPSLSLANDDWQHITLVMKPKSDGTTLKELYINGSIVGENTVNLPFRKRGIKTLIGKWSQDHSKNYNGYIDEIKIWKKALGRTEVYNEYENTRSKIENLALNKAATQSNDHSSGLYGASRAVDGVITGISPDFTHTLHNISEPWWQVDLGKLANIKEIRVYNRTDCCSERLINFHLFVSDVPFTSNTVSDVQGQLGVTDYHFSGQASNLTKQLVNKTGRYIRIQLEGTGTLSLAEVQVFGSFVSVSSKSSAKSRSIEVVNEAEDIPLTDLIIHPNASDGHFNIDFGITKVTDVTYNIYNLSGQRLLSERKVFNKAGNHRWKVDASQLSDGIYILEITSDLWKESKRLVIKK
ncbi:LamG-like jellyroll fold domain-containing protein [Pontimicrobium sp. MEBiC01747]